MREINIKNNSNLTKEILKEFKNLKYSSLLKAYRNKDIKVNNKSVLKDQEVISNDNIKIYIKDDILFGLPKEIKYYYSDNNIVIAFKPNNIISNNDEFSFENIVKKDLNDTNLKICHRLDANTSGLMIFSKNNKAHEEILKAFENGYIIKEYIAYVNGILNNKNDILTNYLINTNNYSKIYDKPVRGSEKIITEYKVILENKKLNYSKLNITLHTGKTHQIRSHFKYIKHPIIGDSKYGLEYINKKFNLNKQLLFAYKYSFKFNDLSFLNYLNNAVIKLEDDLINISLSDNRK